ncbi:NAD(P)H-dependent oxidoreductase [Streptomyces phaeochromogenes]|uniref:NAD(P)H-dependent oxidoreductase n=1 Tax=Streptomyces phaeochromogenes TaxID=1923 RepID=UPI002DDC1D0E|nr:NAD(P)H-dependent oxidoreductase [Streptomyces phaeochromogenes]WRZ35608.1 NAD(P)H-dependent oxidoreductase [Streptomyces phaeochromogenes]WSJ02481.1 NAD(P)H-dependent oxidoreductase [Streptomyces phaeochromogenes]
MSNVLLVVGHPDLSQSKANAALVDAVRELAHVTVHDLYSAYPDFQIDVAAEQTLLAEHDVIVFQHPVFWYNTTPLFKQWQDKVFTLGWAFTMDGSASQLAGKKAVVAITTGVPADHYTPEGANQAAIETLLSSWLATLRLFQFDIQPMVKLYDTAFGLSDEDLATAAKQYNELLASFAA